MIDVKWFDREFDFSFGLDQYLTLNGRLEKAPELIYQTVSTLPETVLQFKPGGKWSIKEHTGHLLLLEPLWLKRFHEIGQGLSIMSPADLNNSATDKAGFNKTPVPDLIKEFKKERIKTISFLKELDKSSFQNRSIHPRLQKPMRIVDLMFFVAEHDMHHLHAIKVIIEAQKE